MTIEQRNPSKVEQNEAEIIKVWADDLRRAIPSSGILTILTKNDSRRPGGGSEAMIFSEKGDQHPAAYMKQLVTAVDRLLRSSSDGNLVLALCVMEDGKPKIVGLPGDGIVAETKIRG